MGSDMSSDPTTRAKGPNTPQDAGEAGAQPTAGMADLAGAIRDTIDRSGRADRRELDAPDLRQRPAANPTPETIEVVTTAAKLEAAGWEVREIARAFDMKSATLQRYRSQYAKWWQPAYDRALAEQAGRPQVTVEAPLPYAKRPKPDQRTRDKILQATAMRAMGLTDEEIAGKLDICPSTIGYWQTEHAELWKAHYDQAMQAAVLVVRRQAGTEAVLRDPDRYIRQALLAEKWATGHNEALFADPGEVTLTRFFETYYRPNRLIDASPATLRKFATAMKYWRMFTGDPPLAEVSIETLARFRECLSKLRGRFPETTMAANTIRSHLAHVQAVLDKAGPSGPRNRDAADLLDKVPWVRPPRPEYSAPRTVPMEHLSLAYQAAHAMEVPIVDGLEPAAWWQALLVVAFNTGLRKRALLGLRFDHVDWTGCHLYVPPSLSKTRRGQAIHLNAVTIRHLLRIRGDRELIFPWPTGDTHFHREVHTLLDAAGIPRDQHWGLHNIRRTTATVLWGSSPQAAQLQLGHTTMRTTQEHYVSGDEILRQALDELPQPEAFTAESA